MNSIPHSSHNLFFHLSTMLRTIKESKKLFLEEYLEFNIINCFNSSRTWLICYEGKFSEKRLRPKNSNLISSIHHFHMATLDKVGTSIGWLTEIDYSFALAFLLCLGHEKKESNLFFRESIEDIEVFCCHKFTLIPTHSSKCFCFMQLFTLAQTKNL